MAKYKLKKLGFKSFCDDKEDLAFIYERYRPRVIRMLRYSFPKMDDADILESYDTAMLKLYNKASQLNFDEEKSLFGFIERTALLSLYDIHRKQKSYHAHFILLDSPWEGNWEGIGMDEMSSSERMMQDGVYEIINDLKPPCNDVIFLRYYEHVKWKVIAELVVGKQGSKSVHYWQNRCLNLLKALLLKKCPELCEHYR